MIHMSFRLNQTFLLHFTLVLSKFQFGFVSLHHFDFLKILSAICITMETVTPRQLTLATATYFDTTFCWNNCFSKIWYKNILMINGKSNYNYNKLCGNVLSLKQRWLLAASRKSKIRYDHSLSTQQSLLIHFWTRHFMLCNEEYPVVSRSHCI